MYTRHCPRPVLAPAIQAALLSFKVVVEAMPSETGAGFRR